MPKRIFIDSSAIIEAIKGNPEALKLLEEVSSAESLCIIPVVFSEVVYVYIREKSKAATEELRRSPKLVQEIPLVHIKDLLLSCRVLEENRETVELALDYMSRYGVLPNDALILATTKLNNCALLTLDGILMEVAKREGVEVILGGER